MNIVTFPYKLFAFFTVILLSVFVVVISVNQFYVEKGFQVQAEQQFDRADAIMRRYMNERYDRIYADALLLSEDDQVVELIQTREKSLEQKNQILDGDILSKFIDANLVVLINDQGKIAAHTNHSKELLNTLTSIDLVAEVQEEGIGKRTYTKIDSVFFQNVVLPVYVEDQVIGSVFISRFLGEAEITELKNITGLDMMMMDGAGIVLMTEWPSFVPFTNWLMKQTVEDMVGNDPDIARLSSDKNAFYQFKDLEDNFVPPYLKILSFDQRDALVSQIKKVSLILAALGLVFSLIAAYVSSLILKNDQE